MNQVKTIPLVPLSDAVRMRKLGIKQRKSDGRFTFKLRCAVCGVLMKGWCWCTDTLEQAIKAVRTRTCPYQCSNECWFANDGWWAENDEGVTNQVNDYLAEIHKKRIESVYGLRGNKRTYHRFQKLYDKIRDEGDGEPYDDGEIVECDCEV